MKPIALAISDLHLSLTPPACRADKDWMNVQSSYLGQVKSIRRSLDPTEQLPILCAGDIFDRWNTPPELINFALRELPDGMLCVPGQHDLPNHRIEDMERCGYGVLKQTGKIIDISGKHSLELEKSFFIAGFGWGQPIEEPIREDDEQEVTIALIHEYCWVIDRCYPGAPKESHLSAFIKSLRGYDVAVFGDNHKGFVKKLKTGTTVLNCGGFIRRKSDEMDYQPSVGIIYNDGSVRRRRLDTSIDLFHEDAKDREEVPLNMKEFIEGLEGLGEHGLNFREAVENHLRKEGLDEETKEIILAAMEVEERK